VKWWLSAALLLSSLHAGAQSATLERAQQELESGDLPRAAADFDSIRQVQPENKAAWEGEAAALLELDPRRAGQLAAEAFRHWPSDARFLHLRGLAYFRIGNLDAAQTDLTAAEKLSPFDAKLAFDFGLLNMAQKKYDDAARHFELALKAPERASAPTLHILLGRAYQNSNRTEQGIAEFKRALALDPKVPLGHYHLGFAYASLGKNQQALEELQKELARTTDNAEVFYEYGNVLIDSGRFAEAIPPLECALALQPTYADAQYELGKALLLIGKVTEAITSLKRAIELSPDSPESHYQLSRAYSKAGDRESARAELARFSALKKGRQATGGMASGRTH
jgi:protein O-GlcNAc transferase